MGHYDGVKSNIFLLENENISKYINRLFPIKIIRSTLKIIDFLRIESLSIDTLLSIY